MNRSTRLCVVNVEKPHATGKVPRSRNTIDWSLLFRQLCNPYQNLTNVPHVYIIWLWYVLDLLYQTKIALDTLCHIIRVGHGKEKVKLETVVEGDPMAPFSIATTPRCRGGRYSFPWKASLYPWSILYNTACKTKRHQVPIFESLIWLEQGLNPDLPGHWWTLLTSCQRPLLH